MKVYCDTSVLLALASREPTCQAIVGWLADHATEEYLGSFGWGEFVDGTGRRVRRGEAGTGAAGWLQAAHRSFAGWTWVALVDADVATATEFLAADLERRLKLPDAIHIATARRLGATLLTGDQQQASVATDLGIASHLIVGAVSEP